MSQVTIGGNPFYGTQNRAVLAIFGEEVSVGPNYLGFYVLMLLVASVGGVVAFFEMSVLGAVLIFGGLLGGLLSGAVLLWDQRNSEIINRGELIKRRMAFGIAASQWDVETRHFLAREWPEMGVEFGEDQIAYILDAGVNTGILINFLRAFLQDSTDEHFVELRRYNDDKTLQERFNCTRETLRLQWQACTSFLEEKSYLREGTMAGNRTWQWTSREHFEVLKRRYLNVRGLAVMK